MRDVVLADDVVDLVEHVPVLDEVEAVAVGRERVVGEVAFQHGLAADLQRARVEEEEAAQRPRQCRREVCHDERLPVVGQALAAVRAVRVNGDAPRAVEWDALLHDTRVGVDAREHRVGRVVDADRDEPRLAVAGQHAVAVLRSERGEAVAERAGRGGEREHEDAQDPGHAR